MPRSAHTHGHRFLADLLRAARDRAGLNQVEVAEALGKAQSWVSDVEHAQRRLDVFELRDLAGVLGADPHALLDQAWAEQRPAARAARPKPPAPVQPDRSRGRRGGG